MYVYRPEKCKFMDSKMKPLWLVFENADRDGKDIYQIFKHGDGMEKYTITVCIRITHHTTVQKIHGRKFSFKLGAQILYYCYCTCCI